MPAFSGCILHRRRLEMAYTINVARRRQGDQPPRHIFRTARDSILSKEMAILIAKDLQAVYPRPGYEITIGYESLVCQYIDWENEDV